MSFCLDSKLCKGSVLERNVEKKNPLVMFPNLRCGEVNVRVLQLTAITSPGLANAAP